MSDIQSVGIVGLGSFGRFVAGLIPEGVRVLGHDPLQAQPLKGVAQVSLAEAAAADVVILAVSLDAIGPVLDGIKNILRPDTAVVDICSVKVRPEEILRQHLPDHKSILLTHPLFGPQSAAISTAGHRLIITKSHGDRANEVARYCEQVLGLDVAEMSAVEHDHAMARVHALTLFVARGLGEMRLPHEQLVTPSYQMILDLIGLDRAHSDGLFRTIEVGNPFAADIRHELLAKLTEIDQTLQGKGSL